MRCIYCPSPEEVRCPGLDVRRFCELIDPAYPQYEPGYAPVIALHARPLAIDTDALRETHHQATDMTPNANGEGPISVNPDCCGGNLSSWYS
jgi:hypothetical protein